MEIKKTIKPEIRFDLTQRMIIVKFSGCVPTHQALQPRKKMGRPISSTNYVECRFKRSVGNRPKTRYGRSIDISSYRLSKKVSELIHKEIGVRVPASIISDKIQGVYPPIGIKINDKIIKLNKKNG